MSYDEFLDMAAPKVANRDEREEIQKVRVKAREGGREGGRGRTSVTCDEFLDMATPKEANRDEREEIQKVRWNCQLHSLSLLCTAKGKGHYPSLLPSFPPSLPPSFPPF